jgi:hypothetical protein
LPALLALALLDLMAGQCSIQDVERWSRLHPDAWQALGLRRCPSVATLWRLLQAVSVAEVQRILQEFAAHLAARRHPQTPAATLRTVALDGKTLRGTRGETRGLARPLSRFSGPLRVGHR